MVFVRLAVASLLLAGCAQQTGPGGGNDEAASVVTQIGVGGLPRANETFTGSMPFLGRTVPLPEGQWTVLVTEGIGVRNVGPVAAVAALVRHDGPVLHGILEISGNVRAFPHGPGLNPICTSSDVTWNDVREAVPDGRQDCVVVAFVRPVLWREAQKTIEFQVAKGLDALGIQAPNILVTLAIRETTPGWFLDMSLHANPDVEGIAPDMATQRAQSAWTAFNLPRDARKQQFVDKLKTQAAPLRAGLRQQLDAHAPFVPASGLTPA